MCCPASPHRSRRSSNRATQGRSIRSTLSGIGLELTTMAEPFPGKMHFTRMDEGTDEDFRILQRVHEQTLKDLPDRVFTLLDGLGQDTAYNITRRDHCLQTATRALRDGK